MSKIYALLVGINGYPVKPLSGCINDVNAVKDCLERLYADGDQQNLYIEILTDEQQEPEKHPTRENLIKAFNFFEQAEPGDSCMFYYSGHGSFSEAPTGFQTDNGFLQSFVCLDSRLPNGKDLMDKEMSYLIWKFSATHPHVDFLAITDCCHSGTITKGFLDNSNITDRMISGDNGHTPSSVEEFLGYDIVIGDKKAYEISSNGEIKVRQGDHIHLAASRDNQTSKELMIDGQIRGAFTHSLIKCLYETGGRVSYRNLIDQTAVLVGNLVKAQEPDINLNGNVPEDVQDRSFLSQNSGSSKSIFTISYREGYGWCVNGGTIHGISIGDSVISNIGKSEITGIVISSPSPDISVLSVKKEFGPRDGFYPAEIWRQPNQAITLSFAPGTDNTIRELLFSRQEILHLNLNVVSDTGQFIVRSNALNEIYLSYPGDEKPLFKPLSIRKDGDADTFLGQAEKFGKWLRLQEFSSPEKDHGQYYTVKLFRSTKPGNYDTDTFEEIDPRSSSVLLNYQYNNGEWYRPAFRLSITNNALIPIWVTNAYLSFNYSVTTLYFQDLEIAPKTTSWLSFLSNGLPEETIHMAIEQEYLDLGYKETKEFLKLFISTKKIGTDKLRQDGVTLHSAIPETRQSKGDKTLIERGPVSADSSRPSQKWFTETIGFDIVWPAQEEPIRKNTDTHIGSMILLAHPLLEGSIGLSSSGFMARSTDQVPAPHLANHNTSLAPFDLISNTRAGIIMDTVEFFGINNPEAVDMTNPLKFRLPSTRDSTDDHILPLGYDTETGLYFPVGYTDRDGNVIVHTLPQETNSDQAITGRSFFGSIKIYFQKVIGQRLGFKYEYPRLAIVHVDDTLEVTYEAGTAKVNAAVAAADNIILFIHGIIGDTEGMVKCIKTAINEQADTLETTSDLILAFDYENLNTNIATTGSLLGDELTKVGLHKGHNKKLIVVAHSMGGMVTRSLIEQPGNQGYASSLIMLGTPNNGSPWADVRDLADTLITLAINGISALKPWLFVLSGIGKVLNGVQVTLKEMNIKTGIYPTLNSGKDPQIPYTIIAGDTSLLAVQYKDNANLVSRLFTRLKSRGIYDALDLVLFKEPNDIAVTDKSITTMKTPDWKHLPVIYTVASDHMSYFVNTEALKLISDVNRSFKNPVKEN